MEYYFKVYTFKFKLTHFPVVLFLRYFSRRENFFRSSIELIFVERFRARRLSRSIDRWREFESGKNVFVIRETCLSLCKQATGSLAWNQGHVTCPPPLPVRTFQRRARLTVAINQVQKHYYIRHARNGVQLETIKSPKIQTKKLSEKLETHYVTFLQASLVSPGFEKEN